MSGVESEQPSGARVSLKLCLCLSNDFVKKKDDCFSQGLGLIVHGSPGVRMTLWDGCPDPFVASVPFSIM